METHINTYKLNQGDSEYILTTCIVENSMRIACKNTLIDNSSFSKDFTLEELKKLDPIFGLINSLYEGLGCIDKALKKQKVGVSEEGEILKINFYLNQQVNHSLEIPSTNNYTGFKATTTTTETTSTFDINKNLNLGQNSTFGKIGTFDESTPVIGFEQYEKYLSQPNTLNYTQGEEYNQFNTIDTTEAKFSSELANYPVTPIGDINYQNAQYSGNNKITQYTGEISANIEEFTSNNYQINSQYVTAGSSDTTSELGNNNSQYITGNQDLTEMGQFSTVTEDIRAQFSNRFKDAILQIPEITNGYNPIETSTAQYNYPFIDPSEDNNKQSPQVTQINEYKSVTTTNIEPEQSTTTFTLPLLKSNIEQLDLQIKDNPIPQSISYDKINKIDGDLNSLQSEHQLIQDKLNTLSGQVNLYTNHLSHIAKRRAENEINSLRAENMAIKKQLYELRNLRNDAAEVKFLRTKLYELDALRKKVPEMDILRGKLGELNALKAKAAELDSVKVRFNELNNLRSQVSQMDQIKKQLGELNSLRARLEELNRVKSQLGELNKLRAQVGQINILKQKIEELTNSKIKEVDLENSRRKIYDLEKIKHEYELEIQNLKEEQRRSSIEQTRTVERFKTEGMESRQLLFEERPERICVKGEIIHNTDELELLTRKINNLNKKLTLNLLYKATVDSDTAEAFHEKCDEAKSTLVLVETDKGKRFGGYTTCSWSGNCIDKKDEDAFVFSLDKMEIYENIPGEDAIGCYPKFGPIFLGCQIRIYDNAFTKGGTTFEKGLNYNTEEDFELTGGDRVFKIREIEVYEVIPQ